MWVWTPVWTNGDQQWQFEESKASWPTKMKPWLSHDSARAQSHRRSLARSNGALDLPGGCPNHSLAPPQRKWQNYVSTTFSKPIDCLLGTLEKWCSKKYQKHQCKCKATKTLDARVQIKSFQLVNTRACEDNERGSAWGCSNLLQVTFGRLRCFWCGKDTWTKENSDDEETCFFPSFLYLETRDDFHLATDRLLVPLLKAVTCSCCMLTVLALGMPGFWSFSQDRNEINESNISTSAAISALWWFPCCCLR